MIVIVRSKSIDNNSKSKFSNSVNFKDLVYRLSKLHLIFGSYFSVFSRVLRVLPSFLPQVFFRVRGYCDSF